MAELTPLFSEPRGIHLRPRQPGEVNPVADRPVTLERLFGRPDPRFPIKYEHAWHRMAAYMFATGKVTQKQVAEACGVTVPTVSNLLRQAWFQETVNDLMRDLGGGNSVLELFKAEQVNSLVVLTQLRDDAKQSGSVRRAAAVDILDRAMGKPVQTVITDNTVRAEDPSKEIAQLQESIARKREALSKAGVIDLPSVEAQPVPEQDAKRS